MHGPRIEPQTTACRAGVQTSALPRLLLLLTGHSISLYRENAIAIESEASDPNGANVCLFQRRPVRHNENYVPNRGFSRDVTRSSVCLVTPLLRHFGGQAFGHVCVLCVHCNALSVLLINLACPWMS